MHVEKLTVYISSLLLSLSSSLLLMLLLLLLLRIFIHQANMVDTNKQYKQIKSDIYSTERKRLTLTSNLDPIRA